MPPAPEKTDYSLKIKQIRKRLDITQEMFGLPIKVNRANITAYESGTRTPDARIREAIVEKFGINPVWWETGEGEMFLDDRYNKLKGNIKRLINEPDVDYIDLPFVSVPARAGFVENTDSNPNTYETYRVLKEDGVNYGNQKQIIIEMDGDSMEPRYPSRAKVRAEFIPKSRWPLMLPGVYAIAFGDMFSVKRIRHNTILDGYILLESDNTDTGGSLKVPTELIYNIWKVQAIVYAPAL